MKSKAFNIAIFPTEKISGKAKNISKKLKANGSLFVLGNRTYIPHVTVYFAEFPAQNLTKVKDLLRLFSAGTKKFRLTSQGFRQSADGYVDMSFKKTKKIAKLQKDIIALLNPLRENLIRQKDLAKMNELSEIQKKSIRQFGFRSVDSEYVPHLTFTKLKVADRSSLADVPQSNFSFTAEKIGLFYLGEYGSCKKLIETFNLSS